MSVLDRGCTCTLPDDWGSGGGWHTKPIDAAYCKKRNLSPSYIGQPIAIEPCPVYRDAIKRALEKEKRQQTATANRPRIRSES
jgi:hypothetical protein